MRKIEYEISTSETGRPLLSIRTDIHSIQYRAGIRAGPDCKFDPAALALVNESIERLANGTRAELSVPDEN